MRVDVAISEKKFHRELARVLEDSSVWQKRGCFFLKHSFPHVDALFVPKVPLHLAIGNDGQNRQILAPLRSDVTGKPFGARIDMTDYDVIAPSVTFLDAHTWEPVQYEDLPKAHFIPSSGGKGSEVLRQNLVTRVPFLCLEGIREFYDHPQHDNENWFIDRAGFGLQYVLDQLCRTFCEGTAPIIQPAIQFVNPWVAVIPLPVKGQDGSR